jgi:cell division septation protein DedD
MMAKRIDKKPAAKSPEKAGTVSTRKGLWICGIIAVAVWMFFLGVMVGRGTAPVKFDVEKLQKELIALKEELLQKEKKQSESEAKQLIKKPLLDFYETLTEKKEQARLKNIEPSPPRITTQKPISVAKEKTVGTTKRGPLTLQVASLKNPKAAEKLIYTLQKKGYDAYKHTIQIPGRGLWHRVCVGHFSSSADAQKMLKRLREEEKFDPIVLKTPGEKGKKGKG